MKHKPLSLLAFCSLLITSCWTWYPDSAKYRPEITNAYEVAPSGMVDHVGQWVGQMFDAKLSLEILDGKCPNPTIYSDLEFQIRKKETVLMTRQLNSKKFEEKVYLEKGEYRAVLISFARSTVVGDKTFLFEGHDKRISVEVTCR